MMRELELEMPGDLQESLACLPEATPLAGGTNLLVDIRADREQSKRLSAARVFGGQMVRNRATVAGNICSGSPAADTIPPLLSLDANIQLTNKKGCRNVPLDQFCTGFRRNLREPDELITGLSWKPPGRNTANLFYKLARRKGDAIAVVGVGVTVTRKGDRCTQARIALGAVGPTVFRAKDAEKMLTGAPMSEELIEEVAQIAMKQSNPIDDLRASADYRRHSVHVLTRRLITQAWQSLPEKVADK